MSRACLPFFRVSYVVVAIILQWLFRWMGALAFWRDPEFFLEGFYTAAGKVCCSGNNVNVSADGKEVPGNGNGF